MRVISGSLRGRTLRTVPGTTVRPTADRVKEAMFNILARKPGEANVLDLFAGTGGLGIEALSRGARSAVFIDNHPQVLSVLQKNLKHCKIQDLAEVIRWNIEKDLNCLVKYAGAFDLIFMDPPYRRNLVAVTIGHLMDSRCLSPHAIIVAEHEVGHTIDIANSDLKLTDSRRYGSTYLSFFKFS